MFNTADLSTLKTIDTVDLCAQDCMIVTSLNKYYCFPEGKVEIWSLTTSSTNNTPAREGEASSTSGRGKHPLYHDGTIYMGVTWSTGKLERFNCNTGQFEATTIAPAGMDLSGMHAHFVHDGKMYCTGNEGSSTWQNARVLV